MTMKGQEELGLLEKEMGIIVQVAKDLGLDFYDTYFEICPADVIHTIGAYGLPVRFSHWSFGKHFFRLKSQYDLNLYRLYELVINSDPCYAFLLENNSLLQNKMIIAHVLAHSDFFKNNVYFQPTSKKMLDTMAAHAEQIQRWETLYGVKEVEIMLDAVLSLQEHINPHLFCREQEGNWDKKDLLLCLSQYGHNLKDWQRELIGLVREEVLYFWPQYQTKILNEGWATYWHIKIMRALPLSLGETVDFARFNARILEPAGAKINPYLLGYKILQWVERHHGLEELFRLRAQENDLSLVRNYLTHDLIKELDLYLYKKVGAEWVVQTTQPEEVKEGLLGMLVNCGFPTIMVEDMDYGGMGELYLRHVYEGLELDIPFLEKTLPRLYLLWGRPVHLETVVDNSIMVFSFDGQKNSCQILPG